MEINGIYFAKGEFYQIIRDTGGVWNDSKERPFVCLLKIDDTDIYWAIPMGNLNHRNEKAKERLDFYLNIKGSDIRSCFYHIGKTITETIFFISDVIPIIKIYNSIIKRIEIFFISDVIPIKESYIDREYLGFNNIHYVIKNKKLISELEKKLKRILYFEDSRPNYFRQHITDLKNKLLSE